MTSTIDINRASLAQLSISAAELWENIENCPETELTELLDTIIEIQNATELKVDAVAWVVDQLKLDLETWEDRLERVTQMYSAIIQRRINQLEQLKAYLLKLHTLGILPDSIVGKERRINFQNNPAKVELLLKPEELPPQFQQVKISAKSKEILEAHKAGIDISAIADIVTQKHVRFQYVSNKTKKSKS